jgi:outer membrane protein OmpA-like peptidoglycan-associated protein
MKNLSLCLSLVLVFALAICNVQTAAAQRALDRANGLYDKFNYAEALDEYLYLLPRDSNNVQLLRQIGNCYRKLGLLQQSAEWYERVINNDAVTADDQRYYAEALKACGQYESAMFWYRKYAADRPDDRRAQLHLQDPNYFERLLTDSLRYELLHLEINSDKPSFGMGSFNERFVFSSVGISDHSGSSNTHSELTYLDIYVCDLDANGEAINAAPLSGQVNCEYHDGPAFFDATTQTMYVTRNNMKGGRPVYDKSGSANLRIYGFVWSDNDWVSVPDLPFNSNEYSAGHPTMDARGHFMIFVSNMPGGYGGTDLYIAYREGEGWSNPENLGPYINTEGNEMFPFVNPTGTLFFSSDGHAGLGGMDVFSSAHRRMGEGIQFDRPTNLGSPINSSADDFGIFCDRDNEVGYFSSNRGGLGKDNIFRYKLKTFTHQVVAANFTTRESVTLAAKQITLMNLTTGRDSLMRLDETGSFRAMLKSGENYEVYIGSGTKRSAAPVLRFAIDEKLIETYRYLGGYEIDKTPLLAAGFMQERSLAMPVLALQEPKGQGIRERLADLKDKSKLLSNEEFDALSTANLIDESELISLIDFHAEATDSLNRAFREQRLNNLHFGFDSYAIRSVERQKIAALVSILQDAPSAEVVIKAHTDSRGDENYNLLLSMRRAKSIEKALIDRGIEPNRVRIAWLGASELLVDCETQPCTAKDHGLNRRAEIVVFKIDAIAEGN